MRFYVSLPRARRVAMAVRAALRSSSARSVPLSVIQATLARSYGYRDWRELKLVMSQVSRRSPWNEELSSEDVDRRVAYQAEAFSLGLDIPLVAAQALVEAAGPSSSGRTAPPPAALHSGHVCGTVEDGGTVHHFATLPFSRYPQDAGHMLLCILSAGAEGAIRGFSERVEYAVPERSRIIELAATGTEAAGVEVLSVFGLSSSRAPGGRAIERLSNAGVPEALAHVWTRAVVRRVTETISSDRLHLLGLQERPSAFERVRRRKLGIQTRRNSVSGMTEGGAKRLAEATRVIPGIAWQVARSPSASAAAGRGMSPLDVVLAATGEMFQAYPERPDVRLLRVFAGCADPRVRDALAVAPALSVESIPVAGSTEMDAFLALAPTLHRLGSLTQRHPSELFAEAVGDWRAYGKALLLAADLPEDSPLDQLLDRVRLLAGMAQDFARDVARPYLRQAGIDTTVGCQSHESAAPYLFASGTASAMIRRLASHLRDPSATQVAWTGKVPSDVLEEDIEIDLGSFAEGDAAPDKGLASRSQGKKTPSVFIRPGTRELTGHDLSATLARWVPFVDPGMHPAEPERFAAFLRSYHREREAHMSEYRRTLA